MQREKKGERENKTEIDSRKKSKFWLMRMHDRKNKKSCLINYIQLAEIEVLVAVARSMISFKANHALSNSALSVKKSLF